MPTTRHKITVKMNGKTTDTRTTCQRMSLIVSSSETCSVVLVGRGMCYRACVPRCEVLKISGVECVDPVHSREYKRGELWKLWENEQPDMCPICYCRPEA